MKILMVDDHALIRDALRRVLKQVRRGAAVVEASTGLEALEIMASQSDVDLVLLDLGLPDRDGLLVLAELRKRYPTIAIVVLSGIQDRAHVLRALDLGAVGYIPKSALQEVLKGALRLVLAGGTYIPPEILNRETLSQAAPIPPSNHKPIVAPSDVGLTDRTLEVLSLMMQGHNNKMICRILAIGESTVKYHVTVILRALKVKNRTAAVIAVSDLGWELPKIAES